MKVEILKNNIIQGYKIDQQEALTLIEEPLGELCEYANQIRQYFCGNQFDLCSLVNGKCGKCSEDCKYCAQSAHYKTQIPDYPMNENTESIIKEASDNYSKGALRFAIVTSGKSSNQRELDILTRHYKSIKDNCKISLCACHGLLTLEQLEQLKLAGVERYHCNLETSRNYFPQICTTHTYDEKITTIKNAQKIGLSVCSGGIFGLGENWQDRIDMALELRELGIKSIPINILIANKGTPFENNEPLSLDEIKRIVAIYRYILPTVVIKIMAGRGFLADKVKSLFLCGANSCVTGNLLKMANFHIDEDVPMIKQLGFEINKL